MRKLEGLKDIVIVGEFGRRKRASAKKKDGCDRTRVPGTSGIDPDPTLKKKPDPDL